MFLGFLVGLGLLVGLGFLVGLVLGGACVTEVFGFLVAMPLVGVADGVGVKTVPVTVMVGIVARLTGRRGISAI